MIDQRAHLPPVLDEHYLDITLKDTTFYPDTVQRYLVCAGGHESKKSESTNFNAVVDEINQNLKLGFSIEEKQKWSLILHALSAVERFRGDVIVPDGLGENTGIHVSHCPVLATELFRRSGLLEPENQNTEVILLRINICLCLLAHDIGEFVGEPSSLSERVTNPNLVEDPDTEKKILESALRVLYTAIQQNQTGMFYNVRNEMWRAVQAQPSKPAIKVIESVLKKHGIGLLNENYERKLQKDLTYFDRVEHGRDFTGLAAKLIEKLQGTRHWLRFAVRDELSNYVGVFSKSSTYSRLSDLVDQDTLSYTLPISRCTGARIIGNLKYGESLLGDMMASVRTDVEKMLANEIQKAVRETTIEVFSVANPIFDRMASKDSDIINELIRDVSSTTTHLQGKQSAAKYLKRILIDQQIELANRLEKIRDQVDPLVFKQELLPIETRARMMGLYQRAIEVNYQTKPKEILGLIQGQLPQELQGFGVYRSNSSNGIS